jgi:hypothetical protein
MDAAPQRSDAEGAVMSGTPIGYNPFLGPPAEDPGDPRVVMDQAVRASLAQPRSAAALAPRPNVLQGQGPLLSLEDHAALAKAPKLADRPPATTVTVEGRPVRESLWSVDHMFARYNDGNEQFIYRGGGKPKPWLHAEVDPVSESPDFGTGERTLFQTTIPGVTARHAIAPAIQDGNRVNAAHIPYSIDGPNSNTLIGDFTERQFGHRIGDERTLGYMYPRTPPEPVDPIPPGMFRPTNPIW